MAPRTDSLPTDLAAAHALILTQREALLVAEAKAQMAAAAAVKEKIEVRGFERKKPARRPLPADLPRERIVYPSPAACPCCGGVLHKLGEDVTETLAMIPRQWKVVQHVR